MKKKPLLITLSLFLITIAAIWYYQYYNASALSPWNLIDDEAVAVVESPHFEMLTDKLQRVPTLGPLLSSNPAWYALQQVPEIKSKKVLLSVHLIAVDNFGFTSFFSLPSPEDQQDMQALHRQLTKIDKFTLRERTYNGHKISEYLKGNVIMLTATQIEDILVVSNASLLLESAIRLYTAKDADLFRNDNLSLFKLPTLQSDEGNLYLNMDNLYRWLRSFVGPASKLTATPIGTDGISDIKIDSNRLFLNGFIVVEPSSAQNVLSQFDEQEPVVFDAEDLVSNRTAAMVEIGISDPDKYFKAQSGFAKQHLPDYNTKFKSISKNLKWDAERFYRSMGNGFAVCFRDNGPSIEAISILGATDDNYLNDLALLSSTLKGDSLYLENYSGYDIREIGEEDFFYYCFYPFFPQGAQYYFARIGDHYIVSESIDIVKSTIDDIESEETWGKSVGWNKYLESSLHESTVNLFFDGRQINLLLSELFNTRWQPLFDSTQFMGIRKGAIQISHLDALYYLNGSLDFAANGEGQQSALTSQVVSRQFDQKITLRPQIVRSHASKEIEVILQDSLRHLFLLSKDLKQEWEIPLKDQLISQVDEIDYYKNGKLQYIAASRDKVYLLDRLGRNVEQFPRDVGQGPIEYFKVVDYDKSRRYRYLLSNTKGNLYLSDQVGALLDGWNPLPIGGRLVASPNHYRVFGRDYFIAVLQNGVARLMNRRGENIPGFPVSMDIRPSGDYFLERGSNLASTHFQIVSGDGQRIQLDLSGKVIRNDVLHRTTNAAQFSLVKSQDEKFYLYLRSDPAHLAVLDAEGRQLFEVQNTGSEVWKMCFIETPLKDKVICLYDAQQSLSLFFNQKGRSLLSRPIESTLMPTLYHDTKANVVYVFNVNEQELSRLSLKP